MDRNSILGLVLIGGILIGWLFLNQPSEADRKKAQLKQDSLRNVENVERAKMEAATIKAQDTTLVKGDTTAVASIGPVLNTDSINKAKLQSKYRDFTPAVQGENKK